MKLKSVRSLKTFILAAAACAMLATPSYAVITYQLIAGASPATGLESWTLRLDAGVGEKITSVSLFGTNLHQVWPFSSTGTMVVGQTSTPPFGVAGWEAYDSHILVPSGNLLGSPSYNPTETNNNSDPAGLALMTPGFPTFPPTVGVGYSNTSNSGAYDMDATVGITGAASLQVVDFFQIVRPTGGAASQLTFRVFTDLGGDSTFNATIPVPEPTTFAMLLGGVGMLVALRRRRLS